MRLGWSRAFANARWSFGGLWGRRRIHAAGLVKFFGLVRGLRCCCSVAASCGSTLAGPTPLRPAGFLPAPLWKFRRGMGLVIAGLRPAGLASPPASCRLASLANANAPAASMPPELHLPTVSRPAPMGASRAIERQWRVLQHMLFTLGAEGRRHGCRRPCGGSQREPRRQDAAGDCKASAARTGRI